MVKNLKKLVAELEHFNQPFKSLMNIASDTEETLYDLSERDLFSINISIHKEPVSGSAACVPWKPGVDFTRADLPVSQPSERKRRLVAAMRS